MLQELWAKTSAREKLVVYGAGAVAIGVIVGLILATKSYGGGSVSGVSIPGVSVNYFTAENAGTFALLALIGAIVTLLVVYNHVAPKPPVATLPAPYGQVLIAVAGITAACAILVLLMQLIRAGGLGPEPPIFLYVADLLVVGGGALLAYVAYMEWQATKTTA